VNDLVALAIHRACEKFGSRDVFNGACFSHAFCAIAGIRGPIDGYLVRAILTGRTDVVPMEGGAHYRRIYSDAQLGRSEDKIFT
jgi:hypothetical protein